MTKVDVIFSANLNSIVGPVQTLKRIISNHSFFEQNGYDLTVFTLDNLDGTKTIQSVKVQDVAKTSSSKFVKKVKEIARFFAQHSFLYGALRIKILLSAPSGFIQHYLSLKREPEIIVFHYIFDCYNYLKQNKNTKAKIVLFVHADSTKNSMLLEYFPHVKGTSVERKLDKISEYVMNNVDRVISISKIAATYFVRERPQLESKIGTVVNGIDDISSEQLAFVKESKGKPYNKKYRLISCGSINGRKGQWIVIEALKKLPAEIRNEIEYTIVGDGPQRITLEEDVIKSGLQNVRFVGSVPNMDVYKYLAGANIAILMSNNEGLPLSLIEALRCGLAGISTRVAGIPEVVVDRYNGVLIEPDVDQLYEILLHLGDYDWEEMGHKSRILFEEQYTFERMKKDYLGILESL